MKASFQKSISTVLTALAVLFIFSNAAFAQTWSAPVEPVSPFTTGGYAGPYSKLLAVNTMPAMAYYDATRDNLVFVRATNISGTAFGTPVTLDSTGDVGQFISLQIVNGNPAISYYDVKNHYCPR